MSSSSKMCHQLLKQCTTVTKLEFIAFVVRLMHEKMKLKALFKRRNMATFELTYTSNASI